jgi:LmbE family N-acetylglucosaminyl deacetylase
LTRGELGQRGSAEIRDQEATAAAEILGVSARENLEMRWLLSMTKTPIGNHKNDSQIPTRNCLV